MPYVDQNSRAKYAKITNQIYDLKEIDDEIFAQENHEDESVDSNE